MLPGPAVAGVCPDCWSGLRPLVRGACPVCSLPREAFTDLDGRARRRCASCAATTRGFDRLVAALPYRGTTVVLHRLLKFGRREELAVPLGRRMAAAFRASGQRADLVVPLPPDPRRRWRVDPALLLAREAARVLGLGLDRRALRKCRSTPRQTHRSRLERRLGLAGAFRARRPARLAGRRVLLVDDVATTLATAEAASRALSSGGASGVVVLALARTPLGE
jgi:predicted amidophosphoribosyltransferase